MTVLELKLDDEASVFVEVQAAPAGQGGRRQHVATDGGRLEENFTKVGGSIRKLAEVMESQLAAMRRRPDKVQLEMGAQLKGSADLWLVSGEATAHMKITMVWDRPQAD